MPKSPWPAVSEVLRHNLLILVGLPSLIHGLFLTPIKHGVLFTSKTQSAVSVSCCKRPLSY